MNITRALAAIAIAIASLAGVSAPVLAQSLPLCQYEDGNTDGTRCSWTDPDTGQTYLVDSANYR